MWHRDSNNIQIRELSTIVAHAPLDPVCCLTIIRVALAYPDT